MIQKNNWQHQADINSSQHSQPQQPNSIHDLFGQSTNRPISAPPTAINNIHDLSNGRHMNGTTNSNETKSSWGGTTSLYRNASFGEKVGDDINDSEQQFHLPHNSQFNFQQASVQNKYNDRVGATQVVPPGLGFLSSSSTTTSVTAPKNKTNDMKSSSSSSSLYNGDFDIMSMGSRRSASTGVIGQTQRSTVGTSTRPSKSVMASLGLEDNNQSTNRKMPPGVMELIQEDDNVGSNAIFSSSNHGGASSHPSTTNSHHQHHNPLMAPMNINFQTTNNNLDRNILPPNRMYSNNIEMSNTMSNGFNHDGNGSIYNNTSRRDVTYPNNFSLQKNSLQSSHHMVHSQHQQQSQQQQPYQQQQMYYSSQRSNDIVGGSHRIIQTGQNGEPVYVNSTPYTGYTAVQYHQQPPSSHYHAPQLVIHSHETPMNARFVSTIPVQGSIPTQVPTNGAFIYFQPPMNDSSLNLMQTPNGSANANKARHKVQQRNGLDRSRKNYRGKNNGTTDSLSSAASAILEEFRNDSSRAWSAFDAKGYIVEFCQDQNGSRFIQQRLEAANDEEKTFILSEILPEIHKLRVDIFGNYVVQKLFDFGTVEMIRKVKETIVSNMTTLSNQMYGCRVVQKALEVVSDEDLLELLSELHNNMLACVHDQNGNHVIQKYIEVVNKRVTLNEKRGDTEMALRMKQEIKIVFNCVTEDVLSLACHPYGCRVFQRILEHFCEEQKDHVLMCINHFHQELLDDQYGNYVIQHVLQYGRTLDRDSILEIVVKNSLLHLSRQKFASNVVEKLLKYGNQRQRKAIVREMLKKADMNGIEGVTDDCSVVLMMVRDAYANYVVQTTLDVVPEGEEKKSLYEELNNHSVQLRNYTFAKHIIAKLESN